MTKKFLNLFIGLKSLSLTAQNTYIIKSSMTYKTDEVFYKTIYDVDKKGGILLMENPIIGNKYQHISKINNTEQNQFKPVKTGKTHDILGFICDEYEIKDNIGNKILIYTSADLKLPLPGQQV